MRAIGEAMSLRLMRLIDPERAHGLAIRALQAGLGPKAKPDAPELRVEIAGLKLPNPLGLAAGFDKNGDAIAPLLRAGFGFVEIGAVTPRPQPGNPRPRLFRLMADEAAINRFGFNNLGMDAMKKRLEAPRPDGVLGVNLGANKDSEDRAQDYQILIEHLGGLVDFCTINVSSPNTEKLRDLQGEDALRSLIEGALNARARHAPDTKIFLKIAPDLTQDEVESIANLVKSLGIDALIATNTTLSRDGLQSKFRNETGGLSGKPLADLSTKIIAQAYGVLGDDVPIIGVGGIDSAKAAQAKLDAGARALQLYTALVYHGFGLLDEIKEGLLAPHADKTP